LILGFKLFKHKKGNIILDMILALVIIMVFAFSIFFGYKLLDEVNTSFQADADMSTEAKATISNYHAVYPSNWDASFLMFIILLWVFFLVSTFFLDSHPIFFIIFLILIIFVLITSMVINNVWYDTITDDDFSIYQTNFPIIMWYFDNILAVWIVISCSCLVTLFAKSRLEGGGY